MYACFAAVGTFGKAIVNHISYSKKDIIFRQARLLCLVTMPPKRKGARGAKSGPKEKKAKVVAATQEEEKSENAEIENDVNNSTEDSKPESSKTGAAVKEKKPKKGRDPIPDVSELDLSSDAKTADGKKWNMKFSSWNVNGIRAWCEKNGHSYIEAENPDVFCLQETKCEKDKIPDDVNIKGYHTYWLSGDKEGYSGTGLYCKKKPINVSYGININKHDKEGRVITAEFEKFYFVTAYIPNSGRGLPRLKYRTEEWDPDFRKYLKDLDAKKPVIMCGDLNVAHLDIDLANPKSNKNKSAGFTDQEREQFGLLLEEGFVDSFRELYPEDTGKYSYWTFMGNARAKNVGWRLDYFVISDNLKDKVCDNVMRTDVMGSDHCPITLFMHM